MLLSLGHEYKADPKPEALRRVYQQLKNFSKFPVPGHFLYYLVLSTLGNQGCGIR